MASRASVIAWQRYVSGELARYAEHTGGTGRLWAQNPHASRFVEKRRAGSPEEYAFTGPWHIVRKYVTTEFRQWVEEFEATERLTLAQHAERERAAAASRAWLDTPEYVLDRLDEIRRMMAERDALIVEAARRGAKKTAIAEATGLQRQTIHAILAAAEESGDAWERLSPVPDTVPVAWAEDAASTPAAPAEGAPVGIPGWDYVDDSEPF